MKRVLLLLLAILTVQQVEAQKKLKPKHVIQLKGIPEPSDLFFQASSQSFYVVSDKGRLFEISKSGEIIQEAKETGADFEGVCRVGDSLYVVEEKYRMVKVYTANDMRFVRSISTPHPGPRNSGYESIAYSLEKKQFTLFVEKEPCTWVVFDQNFNEIKRTNFSSVGDVSAICFHDGFLWVLSDEDECVLKMNADSGEILERYRLKITAPEGLAFDKDGHLWIVSDDAATLNDFGKINK